MQRAAAERKSARMLAAAGAPHRQSHPARGGRQRALGKDGGCGGDQLGAGAAAAALAARLAAAGAAAGRRLRLIGRLRLKVDAVSGGAHHLRAWARVYWEGGGFEGGRARVTGLPPPKTSPPNPSLPPKKQPPPAPPRLHRHAAQQAPEVHRRARGRGALQPGAQLQRRRCHPGQVTL